MRQKEKRTEQLTCLSEQSERRVDRKLNDWIADILIIHCLLLLLVKAVSSSSSLFHCGGSLVLWCWCCGVGVVVLVLWCCVVVLVLLCMCISVGVVSVVVVGSLLLFAIYPAFIHRSVYLSTFLSPFCLCLSVSVCLSFSL